MSTVIPPITAGTNTIPGNNVTVPSTTNTTSTSSGSGSSTSGTNLASNFNTFLTLLTTQLQNQDPTNPVDSNQFTQQLVEFAGVQQQVQTNSLLQQLVTATQGNQVSSASSFIGTTVQATGNQGGLSNGTATFGYTLPSAAASAVVTVKDASGNVVYVGNGPTTSGQNTITWNGTNSLNGSTEPSGTYSISVQAVDSSGNAITATPFETGTVSSASISNGVVMLNVNGLQIPESSVTSVTNLNAGTSSGSGLSSQLSSLSSAISSLPSEISSSVSSGLSAIGL